MDEYTKNNHIRHTKEALEDIIEGLKNFNLTLIDVGIEPLIVSGLEIANHDNHIFDCICPSTHMAPVFPSWDYNDAWNCAQLVWDLFNNHVYERNGDVWQDAVETLRVKLCELIDKEKK